MKNNKQEIILVWRWHYFQENFVITNCHWLNFILFWKTFFSGYCRWLNSLLFWKTFFLDIGMKWRFLFVLGNTVLFSVLWMNDICRVFSVCWGLIKFISMNSKKHLRIRSKIMLQPFLILRFLLKFNPFQPKLSLSDIFTGVLTSYIAVIFLNHSLIKCGA